MPDSPDRTAITRVIVNARVQTGDPKRPWADAVALAGDHVAAVGSSAALRKLAPAGVAVVDARGAVVRVIEGRVVGTSG